MRALYLLLLLLLVPASAQAQRWIVDPAASAITFTVSHAGTRYEGRFARWSAAINFDPQAMAETDIRVRIDLTSLTTGEPSHPKTLAGEDWFAIEDEGQFAQFTAGSVTAQADGSYLADGRLTIRGHSVAVPLRFTLDIAGDVAKVAGGAKLARLDWGLGKGSDAAGKWVSLDIPVSIRVSARRAAE